MRLTEVRLASDWRFEKQKFPYCVPDILLSDH